MKENPSVADIIRELSSEYSEAANYTAEWCYGEDPDLLALAEATAKKVTESLGDLKAFVSDSEHGLGPDITRIKIVIARLGGES